MKTNMGSVDRAIRAVLGLIIMGVAFELKSEWGIAGLLLLLTAYLGFCPVYHLLHVSTSRPLRE